MYFTCIHVHTLAYKCNTHATHLGMVQLCWHQILLLLPHFFVIPLSLICTHIICTFFGPNSFKPSGPVGSLNSFHCQQCQFHCQQLSMIGNICLQLSIIDNEAQRLTTIDNNDDTWDDAWWHLMTLDDVWFKMLLN